MKRNFDQSENWKKSGFTVIELIVAIVIVICALVLFVQQKNQAEIAARDTQRKSDINNINQNLQKVFYAEKKYYPQELKEEDLPGVFPDTFRDPNGVLINQSGETGFSDYSYEPKDCDQKSGKCKSFELIARLEGEEDYKISPNHDQKKSGNKDSAENKDENSDEEKSD